MHKNIKNKLSLENLLCLYIILCPILDIVSFLFRNYFKTNFSPSTVLRPLIPCICFLVLFFKEKNKKQKIGLALIYILYSIIHLILFQKLHNQSSYGIIKNEIQYIANYSIMIINLYLFYKILQDKNKLIKSVIITNCIYIFSLFFSIITKTSTSTYIEGIGFKGYFESGNSLCTVLILSLCIILTEFNLKNLKQIILIFLNGIYLCSLCGMRTGLFGFASTILVYITAKFFITIIEKKVLSRKKIIVVSSAIILIIVLLFFFGANTLQRRKQLKQNEKSNIDLETGEQRHVTGDILDLYKKIKNNEISDEYMSQEEKNAIVNLTEFANKYKISSVNLREQQLIYNLFLVKEQKNPILILFGNGYKNQTGELVMEMEIPALICNFGTIGFILYMVPFIGILTIKTYRVFKNRQEITIESIMCLLGCFLAIALSCLSGYVFFNFSSMTMAIILFTRKEIKNEEKIDFWNNKFTARTEQKEY